MSPVDRAGQVTGINEKFQRGFRDDKRLKILGPSSGSTFETQRKHGETQNYIFGNYYSCITAVKYDVENTACKARRCHSGLPCYRRIHHAFILLTGLKCSYSKLNFLVR